MTLQGRIHQLRTAAASGCGFNNRQRQRRHPQAVSLDDVCWRQITPSQPRAGPTPAVAIAWHRYLDELRRVLGSTMPPRGGKPARGSAQAVTPDGRANARRIGEGAILNEVDAGTTPPPMARALASHDCVLAQAAASGLSKCDHAVVST